MKCLILAALLVVGAQAHICLTSPMMRGPHPDLYPGDPLCYQRTANCGSLKKGAPTSTYIAGTPTTVTFQQNLNHFWPPTPGHFDVAISYDDEATWTQIGQNVSDYPANNMNTQTYINIPVVFPTAASSAVLRARYISLNQNEIYPAGNTDAIFYSCADIQIVAPGSWGTMAVPSKPQEKKIAASTTSCTAPPRFTATGVETDLTGATILNHKIYYDTVYGMIRWDRSNVALGGSYTMTDYWNLTFVGGAYTPQYIYGLNGPNTCSMYGGDTFFPWRWGSDVNQVFMGNVTSGTKTDLLFTMEGNGFEFEATATAGSDYCVPKAWTHGYGGTIIRLQSQEVSSIDQSLFTLPKACTQTLPDAGCWAHRLKKNL